MSSGPPPQFRNPFLQHHNQNAPHQIPEADLLPISQSQILRSSPVQDHIPALNASRPIAIPPRNPARTGGVTQILRRPDRVPGDTYNPRNRQVCGLCEADGWVRCIKRENGWMCPRGHPNWRYCGRCGFDTGRKDRGGVEVMPCEDCGFVQDAGWGGLEERMIDDADADEEEGDEDDEELGPFKKLTGLEKLERVVENEENRKERLRERVDDWRREVERVGIR